MQDKVKQYMLRYVEKSWESSQSYSSLWGVWICLHPLVPSNFRGYLIRGFPLQVWFLSEYKIRERDVWEYKRFEAIQWKPLLWFHINMECSHGSSSEYKIAIASFAEYENSLNVHFEWFSDWKCGSISRMNFDNDGNFISQDGLWEV